MYHDLWSDAYPHTQPRRAEAILAAAHRLLVHEGGEAPIVLAAAMLATVSKRERAALLQAHVAHDAHAEINGILDADPGNKNAAIVHDAILLSSYTKDLWDHDVQQLEVCLAHFRTASGKRDAQHYLQERRADASESLRPGAQRISAAEHTARTPDTTHKNKASAQDAMQSEEATSGRGGHGAKEGREAYHWADQAALKIMASHGNKSQYTVAAGITPSGVVHFGNFREIITQHLVACGLEHFGKKVRFIYSWDDYDTFRKVPKNLPDQERFVKYLFQPAVDVPDPFDCHHESYAEHFKAEVIEDLPLVGIFPEFLHQHKKYRACEYADDIREVLLKRDEIRGILNEFKTEEMGPDWWPLNVYCEQCNRDRTVRVEAFDGAYGVTYQCECGYRNTFDLRKRGIAKLPWRVDWPMRWRKEKVDFESAGKDHASAGGSFDSGKVLVEKIFHYPMVEYFMYEFVSPKGLQGKMSSSAGNTITLREVLGIYTPELVRFMFANTRPSAAFAVSFDVDIFKLYEDFDSVERLYYGAEETTNVREREHLRRVYELSVLKVPSKQPMQPSFRHLCTYVQIVEGNMDRVVELMRHEIHSPYDETRIRNRAACAWRWVQQYAPEQYRFRLQDKPYPAQLDEQMRAALRQLGGVLAAQDEQELVELFYQLCAEHGVSNTEFFKAAYLVLIGKERGPKLANLITEAGHERVARVLQQL